MFVTSSINYFNIQKFVFKETKVSDRKLLTPSIIHPSIKMSDAV